MAGQRYVITVEAGTVTPQALNTGHQDRAKTCAAIAKLFRGIDAGDWRAGRVEVQLGQGVGGTASAQTVTYSSSSGAQTISVQSEAQEAAGVLTIASGSGTVGGTIGGTAVTVTWGTSDAATCDALATAINANTTVNPFVTAYSRAATGTVTISSGSGTVTATIGGVAISTTWASSDTATATALATAINAHPTVGVVASSSAGVVTVYARSAGSGGNSITLAASGTGVTASGANLANGGTNANVVVSANSAGPAGTGITLAASGTGVTASTGANLVGGNLTGKTTVSFTAGSTDTATVQNAIAALRASSAMCGLVFVPTAPIYGSTMNTSSTLTLWANTAPTANALGTALYLTVTGTGATVGGPNPTFSPGVNATPNGFNL